MSTLNNDRSDNRVLKQSFIENTPVKNKKKPRMAKIVDAVIEQIDETSQPILKQSQSKSPTLNSAPLKVNPQVARTTEAPRTNIGYESLLQEKQDRPTQIDDDIDRLNIVIIGNKRYEKKDNEKKQKDEVKLGFKQEIKTLIEKENNELKIDNDLIDTILYTFAQTFSAHAATKLEKDSKMNGYMAEKGTATITTTIQFEKDWTQLLSMSKPEVLVTTQRADKKYTYVGPIEGDPDPKLKDTTKQAYSEVQTKFNLKTKEVIYQHSYSIDGNVTKWTTDKIPEIED